MMTQQKRSQILYTIPLAILIIPMIAMQFTKEVNWTFSDFLIMGILLFITTFTINFVLKKFKTLKSRMILVIGILFLLVLIWAELAVGIFESPFAGN